MMGRDTMLFQWRTMDIAPRDGTAFVHVRFLTYCGGNDRPCDLAPELRMLQRIHYTSAKFDGQGVCRVTKALGDHPEGWGNWYEARYNHSMSGDADLDNCRWLHREEYARAVDELGKTWDRIPDDRPPHFAVKQPLVLVRPIEPRVRYDFSHDVLDAEVVWRAHGGWQTAKSGTGKACHPRFLDGHNVNGQPFRWCKLEDFVPPEILENHEDWRRRKAALDVELRFGGIR